LRDDEESLSSIATMIERKNVSAGHAIIKEGDEGDEMFILYKGVVEVRKNTLAKETYIVAKLTAEPKCLFWRVGTH